MKKAKGQVLVVSLIIMTVVLILTSSLLNRTADFLRFGSRTIISEQALSLAEAGIDKALWQLNSTAGSYSGETNTSLGNVGTFSVSVENKNSNFKTITSTGYVPDSSNPRNKRTVKMDVAVNTQVISFNYGVQVGIGGLTMSNSARINGNVHSNKPGQSITGFNSSLIDGDAFAVGTISSPDPTVTGTKAQNQPQTEMPIVDYQFWKNQAQTGGTVDCALTPTLCTITGNSTIGPKKYIGNLSVTNNALLTITGPIHVTGDFSMSQGLTKIKVSDSLGSNGTVLIADGNVNLTQGGTFETTNSNPKGYLLVATTSTNANAMTISQAGQTALFYALEGGATLSQTAQVSALVARSLQMDQSSSLNYEQGLASASFSSGPGGSWQPIKGTYRYTN